MPEYKPKRRKVKFPAFEDKEGVKLTEEDTAERVVFSGDDFLTNHIHAPRPIPEHFRGNKRVISYDEVPLREKPEEKRFTLDTNSTAKLERYEKKKKQFAPFEHEGTFFETNPSKEVRRRPLPKIDPRFNKNEQPERPKSRNFERKKPLPLSKQEELRISEYRKELEEDSKKSLKQQYSRGLNRFKTRSEDMPAKLARKQKEELEISQDELYARMIKPEDSYLLAVDLESTQESHEIELEEKPLVSRAPRTLENTAGTLVSRNAQRQIRKTRPLEHSRINKQDKPAFTGMPKVNIERKPKGETAQEVVKTPAENDGKRRRLGKGLEGLMSSEKNNSGIGSIENRLFERKSGHQNN